MEKKVNVYMMIGFPGAGKDTWIKNHLPNTPAVCRDDIRYELGFCGREDRAILPLKQEKAVTDIFANRLADYVKNGQDVIINNTNLKREYRNEYKKLLEKYNVKWIYVVVEAPDLETNIERRKGQIPAEAFPRIKVNYQPPTPDEYDEIIYDKQ